MSPPKTVVFDVVHWAPDVEPPTDILSAMAIGLKLDIEFSGPEGQRATFGDLKRFVKRAETGGCADEDELHIEMNENDEITGFSVYLDPNS